MAGRAGVFVMSGYRHPVPRPRPRRETRAEKLARLHVPICGGCRRPWEHGHGQHDPGCDPARRREQHLWEILCTEHSDGKHFKERVDDCPLCPRPPPPPPGW